MSDPRAVTDDRVRRVRHKKRGSTYVVIGVATAASQGMMRDGTKVVVYRSESDGKLWFRLRDEFNDGRFEDIEDA